MNKVWHGKTWDEYIGWQNQDKKTLKSINTILKDIDRQPFTGIGNPTKRQEQKLCQSVGSARFIYNWTLKRQEENYKNGVYFVLFYNGFDIPDKFLIL